MKIFIDSPKIFSPGSKWHLKTANVLIENGSIAYIGKEKKEHDELVEGKGCWLTPGWFDLWAHFWDPGHENKEDQFSGREAAAAGGFTGVAVIPNTEPVISSKNDITYLTRANDQFPTALFPYAAVSKATEGTDFTEMIDLHQAGAVAFTDGESPISSSELVVKSLQYLQKMNGLLIQKPYDTTLASGGHMHEGLKSTELGLRGIPSLAEDIIVQRDLSLLDYAGGKLHFATISTSNAVNSIKKAKKSGAEVTSSTAWYNLLLTDEMMDDFDSSYKVMPPLRSKKHVKSLIKGLQDGTIDVICSNHVPHDVECKDLEFDLADFGVTGLQNVAPALTTLSTEVPMETLLEKVSVSPREVLGLNVPEIEENNIAELTLFDPRKKWVFDKSTNKSKSDANPFFGKELTGKCTFVIRGENFQRN